MDISCRIVWESEIPKNVTVNPASMFLGINWSSKTRRYEKKIKFYPSSEVIVANVENNEIICAFQGSDEYYGSVRNVVKIGKSEDHVVLFVKIKE